MTATPSRAASSPTATVAPPGTGASTPPRSGQSFTAALRHQAGPGMMAGARASSPAGEGAVPPGVGAAAVDRALLLAAASRDEPAPGPSAAGCAHRVALAVQVLRAGERSRVEIGLPAGAAVQLESVRDGVSVTVLAGPGNAYSAAAQLPALVEALTSRGVKIAEARLRSPGQRERGGGRSR